MKNFRTLNKKIKAIASALSITCSLNATSLALEKNELQNQEFSKQKVSSIFKKKLGIGLSVSAAAFFGIERLVAGKWFPLLQTCIPRSEQYRNTLVVSKDMNARTKFTKIMFDGSENPGHYTGEYTYTPENSDKPHTTSINYYVHAGVDEFPNDAIVEDVSKLYCTDNHGKNFKFKCIVIAVDGDQEAEKVIADIRSMVDHVYNSKSCIPCEILVAICTDRNNITTDDPFFAYVNNHGLGHLEVEYLNMGRGLNPGENGVRGQFLQGGALNTSEKQRIDLVKQIEEFC